MNSEDSKNGPRLALSTRLGASLVAAGVAALVLTGSAIGLSGGALHAFLPMTVAVSLAAWVLVGLPLAARYGGERALPGPWTSCAIGAVAAVLASFVIVLAYLLLSGGRLHYGPGFTIAVSPFVALTGCAAAATYRALLLRAGSGDAEAAKPSNGRRWRNLWAGPALLLVLGVVIPFVAWPQLERHAGWLIYDVATPESTARIQCYALEKVRVGDTVESVAARLPQVFTLEDTHQTADHHGHRWHLEVVDGLVTEVWVEWAAE